MTKHQAADITFLALTLWREARGESIECREAIASVIMTRAASPGWWGKDVMGVVTCPWQFSSLTDPKDRQLTTWPKSDDKQWLECLVIAEHAIALGFESAGDHYYDNSIKAPKWANHEKFVKQIGRVKFYRLNGGK